MSNPHRISLHQVKAWSVEQSSGEIRCTRSFGAPERVRLSSRTTLCISGESLPSKMLLNGQDAEITAAGADRIESELGRRLEERNRVVLVWDTEGTNQAVKKGLESLREIYLEIWE